MRIKESAIGESNDPYFIAEAGVNHNGDLEIAKKLIEIAADAGADAVKFQTFSADRLVSENASTAEYQEDKTDVESQRELLQQYELDRAAHKQLHDYCADVGITFLSTPFDADSADLLAELGVPAIKVGSGELDNHPLLKHIAGLGRPMIVSTGMATMEEVHAAHNVIQSVDSDLDLIFLHCTSAYPAAVEDVNLRAMQTMDAELSIPVGFSDHTTLPETSALAVAAGACLVEKHFTIDSTLPGPDHEISLEPTGLERSVNLVRTAADTLGESTKRPVEAELETRSTTRKSLHAARDLQSGTELSPEDIDIVRPAEGISPARYNEVLGCQVVEQVGKSEPLTEGNVSFPN